MIQSINKRRCFELKKKLIRELLPKEYYVTDTGKVINSNGHIMKSYVVNSGYEVIRLVNNHFSIHRLVAEYFCDGYKPYLVVDHINNDRLDNRASNLRWVTAKENYDDMVKRGRLDTESARQALKKRRNTAVYMLDKDTEKILAKFDSIREASKTTGVNEHTISAYLSGKPYKGPNGKYYRHKSVGGYKWKLADPKHDNGMTRVPMVLVSKKTGEKFSFPSMNQVAKFLNRDSATVSNWVKRGYKEHDGYLLNY